MESMTGYAFIENSTEQFSYSIEIKSLNSKYFEIYTDLPRLLQKDENEIKALVKKLISRGKVVVSIDIFNWIKERSVSINSDLIKQYYNKLKSIENDLKIDDFFTGDVLFSLDNVVRKERTVLSEKSRNDIFQSLNTSITKVLKMRQMEGNATKKDIQKLLSVITSCLNKIKPLTKGSSKELYKKLKNNIESIVDSNVSDVRLLTEVAVLTDKLDTNEEVVRLSDHLKKAKSMMSEKGQIGKRLDFLAQEMFREINTISSKANNSEISHLAVEMKNHIDKIREQSRNIV